MKKSTIVYIATAFLVINLLIIIVIGYSTKKDIGTIEITDTPPVEVSPTVSLLDE